MYGTRGQTALHLTRKQDQNAFIERFNRTYRTEALNVDVFETLDQVRQTNVDWLQCYNKERLHDALASFPPAIYRVDLEAGRSPLSVFD